MDEEDCRRLAKNGGGPYQWGVRDREKHQLIVALWKQYPALLSLLADLKSVAKKNAQLTEKAYEGRNYRFLGFFSMQAGETKAEGYRFSYSEEGVSQTVDTFLIKDGKTIYAFLCGGREENMDADHDQFCRILESLEYV